MKRFFSVLSALLLFCTAGKMEETRIDPAFPVPDYVHWLLQTADEEVGYTEGDHGYSKYGEWGGDPYAQWCAEFLCWCVDQVDQRHGTSLLRNIYPRYSGSNTGRSWFIHEGRFVCRWGNVDDWGYQWLKGEKEYIHTGSYIPQPGDWMFFTWTSGTDTDHVAMVEYCTRDENGQVFVHVIEGNKPSAVARDVYELNNTRILGYGTVHDVMDITMRFGNNGVKVSQLQDKLSLLGYLDAQYVSGHFGNATAEALQTFQQDHGLRSSGIANITTQLFLDEAVEYKIDNDPLTWTVIDEDD